jgi:hypothetical protein
MVSLGWKGLTDISIKAMRKLLVDIVPFFKK